MSSIEGFETKPVPDYSPKSGRRKIIWALAIVFILFFLLGWGSKHFTSSGATQIETPNFPQAVIAATNAERVKAGLPELKTSQLLTTAAGAKADDMVVNHYFDHVSPSGIAPWNFIKAAGYNYTYAGENLAINYEDPQQLVDAWMKSESHRANILSPFYTEVGVVGVVEISGEHTGILVVEMFGAPAQKKVLVGKASYYDYVLKDGWSSKGHRVCAVRDWPRGTMLKVTNQANGKTVICKVTDFGPHKATHPDRIIDLSSFSFSQIADTKLGIINVSVEEKE